MILLQSNKLIISYNPYVYKEGGFCITINQKSEIKVEEISLEKSEINQLLKSQNHLNKNKIPIYSDLLNEYFNSLEQIELI